MLVLPFLLKILGKILVEMVDIQSLLEERRVIIRGVMIAENP